MDVKNIESEIDLRLNLLSGDLMFADNIELKPLDLIEIKKVGYANYSKYLSLLTLDKEEVSKDNPELDKFTMFDIVIHSGVDEIIESYAEGLCLFLREDRNNLLINKEVGFIFGGMDWTIDPKDCKIINSGNYGDIVQMLKYQNCLIGTGERYERYDPADEMANKIAAKLKKGKKEVARIKSEQSNSNIDFADIVSAVSTKSNTYNKQNIWDLTIYQLYDEYKRLEMISGYEINIMAMVQGAKIDNLKHWSEKID